MYRASLMTCRGNMFWIHHVQVKPQNSFVSIWSTGKPCAHVRSPEHCGYWDLHNKRKRNMLPYFSAAGSIHYMKSAQLHLQPIQYLLQTICISEFHNLMKAEGWENFQSQNAFLSFSSFIYSSEFLMTKNIILLSHTKINIIN